MPSALAWCPSRSGRILPPTNRDLIPTASQRRPHGRSACTHRTVSSSIPLRETRTAKFTPRPRSGVHRCDAVELTHVGEFDRPRFPTLLYAIGWTTRPHNGKSHQWLRIQLLPGVELFAAKKIVCRYWRPAVNCRLAGGTDIPVRRLHDRQECPPHNQPVTFDLTRH